jgi:hypothetical protein
MNRPRTPVESELLILVECCKTQPSEMSDSPRATSMKVPAVNSRRQSFDSFLPFPVTFY